MSDKPVVFEVGEKHVANFDDEADPIGWLLFGEHWPRMVAEHRARPPQKAATLTVTAVDKNAGTITCSQKPDGPVISLEGDYVYTPRPVEPVRKLAWRTTKAIRRKRARG